MTKAAKKWLSEYKKLFNEVSSYNKGQSEGVRKIERLGRVVKSGESAEFRTQSWMMEVERQKKLTSNFQRGIIKEKFCRLMNMQPTL